MSVLARTSQPLHYAHVPKRDAQDVSKITRKSLAGKHCVFTGATSGIGRVAVKRFAQLGLKQLTILARNVSLALELKKELSKDVKVIIIEASGWVCVCVCVCMGVVQGRCSKKTCFCTLRAVIRRYLPMREHTNTQLFFEVSPNRPRARAYTVRFQGGCQTMWACAGARDDGKVRGREQREACRHRRPRGALALGEEVPVPAGRSCCW